MSVPAIAVETFMSLTTYRTSNDEVSTPVWVVALQDGRIGFWTAMGTGKTKRLRRDPRVVVRPFKPAIGSVSNAQLAFLGSATSRPGVLIRKSSLSPPASSRQTRRLPSSLSRPATALPALPPPITITSN